MYDRLKEEIPRILEIVEKVPEPFKLRCFELLFAQLLRSAEQATPPSPATKQRVIPAEVTPDVSPPALPARVRAFLRRHNLDEAQLQSVVMMADGEVHFIREPRDVPNATGQIQWALLLALQNAIIGGAFEVDPEDVRSICIEKGYYDRGNFAANFKQSRNAALFRGEMVPQGERRSLSDDGMDRLADLIRNLTSQG